MTTYGMRVLRLIAFAGWYALELLRSYARMLVDIVNPGPSITPAVVRFDTHCASEAQVGLLGVLITLAPGTIVLDARAHAERSDVATPWTLYVHGIHHPDPDDLRASLSDLERRLLTAWGHPEWMDRPTAGSTGGTGGTT